jgi:hypothetical protein
MMKTIPMSEAKTADFRGIEAALARAADIARIIAKQFNTPLIVQQNDKLTKLNA